MHNNSQILFHFFERISGNRNPELFVENLPLQTLDNNGNVITTIQFKGVTIASLSELTLNYTQNAPSATSFTAGFNYNYLSIDLEMAR